MLTSLNPVVVARGTPSVIAKGATIIMATIIYRRAPVYLLAAVAALFVGTSARAADTSGVVLARLVEPAVGAELLPGIGVAVIRTDDPAGVARQLVDSGEAEWAEVAPRGAIQVPEWTIAPAAGDGVPLYGAERQECRRPQWHLPKIGAPVPGIVPVSPVAVVDTGVDCSHPDLACVKGWDAFGENAEAVDITGHGTFVAGLIGADGKARGVAPGVAIMPVRVIGPFGGTVPDMAAGIVWATDHGAPVVNVSAGSSMDYQTLELAIQYAVARGVTVIAAAGNHGTELPWYPAFYSEAWAVGATDQDDRRPSWSAHGSWVPIYAPGVDILSTRPGGGYSVDSGTSASAPLVSGAASLALARGYSMARIVGSAHRTAEGLRRLDVGAAVATSERVWRLFWPSIIQGRGVCQ